MKTKAILSPWLFRDGRRLDCGPYMSGALEAKAQLQLLQAKKQALREVTLGGLDGIVNAGRIKRIWVEDAAYGHPFLSSTDILQADLSSLRFISRKAVRENPKLLIRRCWTLITRAGTIGRMAYVRPDMDGMACSEDVLRVIPDETKIPPGYLYAYLSSKFGVPLIVGGTYGAIIQHIEPHHIADLPVPRLGEEIEGKVHALVEEAAHLRTTAAEKLFFATRAVTNELMMPAQPLHKAAAWWGHSISSSELDRSRRFEGYYFNPVAQELDQWAIGHPNGSWPLGDVASVFDVPPFKHIYVETEHGIPFFTSGDLFRLERNAEKHLSLTRTRELRKYVLKKGWILLARSGQLGGIIGRPQFADSSLDQVTTSDHVIRIVPQEECLPAGYLFAYLATLDAGYPLLTRTMTGASVPALWPAYLNSIPVVKADTKFMAHIDQIVREAFEMRVQATAVEAKAHRLVEQAIEEAH